MQSFFLLKNGGFYLQQNEQSEAFIFGMKNVNFVWNCIDIEGDFAYNTKGNKYKPT